MRSWFVMMALCMTAGACDDDDCDSGSTRCSAETVELCVDNRWQSIANCLDVTASDEPVWGCCPVSGGPDAGAVHACLPATECAEVAQ